MHTLFSRHIYLLLILLILYFHTFFFFFNPLSKSQTQIRLTLKSVHRIVQFYHADQWTNNMGNFWQHYRNYHIWCYKKFNPYSKEIKHPFSLSYLNIQVRNIRKEILSTFSTWEDWKPDDPAEIQIWMLQAFKL